jgi:hypothetical protein
VTRRAFRLNYGVLELLSIPTIVIKLPVKSCLMVVHKSRGLNIIADTKAHPSTPKQKQEATSDEPQKLFDQLQ